MKKKNIDYTYIINVEQVLQKIHLKYTFYDLGFLCVAGIFFLYFDSVDMAGTMTLFSVLIYHKTMINKKRSDYGEVYLLKKIHLIKEYMRSCYKGI